MSLSAKYCVLGKHHATITGVFKKGFAVCSKNIVVEHLEGADAGISVVGLNRVEGKNSFNQDLVSNFSQTIEDLRHDSKVRVVVLRSLIKGVFCAGADLKERLSMPQDQVGAFVSRLRKLTSSLEELPIPVIAAIDGVALGGGLELALACDIRVVGENAKLGLLETKLAILPGAGGTQRLPRLINPAIAKEMIYTARLLDGTEAHQLGIANHVVKQNENGESAFIRALEVAREILPNGPIGVKLAKVAINKGLEVDMNTGNAIEEACYSQVIPTKDRIEGLEAFNEKRKPMYKGE